MPEYSHLHTHLTHTGPTLLGPGSIQSTITQLQALTSSISNLERSMSDLSTQASGSAWLLSQGALYADLATDAKNAREALKAAVQQTAVAVDQVGGAVHWMHGL